jgi:hypothetical protein
MASSHAERVLTGRLAAYVVHSRYDSRELTKAARAVFKSTLEREVDPDGVLPEVGRFRRAEMARKAHVLRLALKSARVRRRRRELTAASVGRKLAGPAGSE